MLRDVDNWHYLVYPPRATLEPHWNHLVERYGHDVSIEFNQGAYGGGVILIRSTLPVGPLRPAIYDALISNYSFTTTRSMQSSSLGRRVVCAEPILGPSVGDMLPMTAECVDIAERQYWGFEFLKCHKHEIMNMVNEISASFNLGTIEVAPERAVLDEVKHWSVVRNQELSWFLINGGSDVFGFQWAVLVYAALCLRERLGRELKAAHLFAAIEGGRTFRRLWSKHRSTLGQP